MKRRTTRWLAVLLLAVPLAVPAQAQNGQDRVLDNSDVEQEVEQGGKRIYRTVDEHGNPVFTDSPPDSGPVEEVEVAPANTLPMETNRPRVLEMEPEPVRYRLAVASPMNEQTFQNPSEPIKVWVRLSPALEPNHRLVVTANGEPLPGSLQEGFSYRQPVRGEHRLQARVLEGSRVLEESEEVIIYVHRNSVMGQQSDSDEGARRRPGYQRGEYPGRPGYSRGDYSRPGPSDNSGN